MHFIANSIAKCNYIIAFGCGAILAISVISINISLTTLTKNDPVIKACKWPKQDGEMTVITLMNSKYVCWVWK